MDANDLSKLLKTNTQQLNHMLNACQNGSNELKLLASQMGPLLESLSLIEAELLSSMEHTDDQPPDNSV